MSYLISNNSDNGQFNIMVILDETTRNNISNVNNFVLFYMLLDAKPSAFNVNNVIVSNNNVNIIRNNLRVNINLPLFDNPENYAIIYEPLMSKSIITREDQDPNNYYNLDSNRNMLLGNVFPPWTYASFSPPFNKKLSVKDILNILKLVNGSTNSDGNFSITYESNQELFERILGKIYPMFYLNYDGSENIMEIDQFGNFIDLSRNITVLKPTNDYFENNITLYSPSEQQTRFGIDYLDTFEFDTNLSIADVNQDALITPTDYIYLLKVLVYKEPIGIIPQQFIPPEFNQNSGLSLTANNRINKVIENARTIYSNINLTVNNSINPRLVINEITDLSFINYFVTNENKGIYNEYAYNFHTFKLFKLDISYEAIQNISQYGWSGIEFSIALYNSNSDSYNLPINLLEISGSYMNNFTKKTDTQNNSNIYFKTDEINSNLLNYLNSSKVNLEVSDELNNNIISVNEINTKRNVTLKKLIFYFEEDNTYNYPLFNDHLSIYLPLVIPTSVDNSYQLLIYDLNISDNGIDNNGIINDYNSSQINKERLIQIYPESDRDFSENFNDVLNLNTNPPTFDLIIDQNRDGSYCNITYEITDPSKSLTGIMLLFDNSFDIPNDYVNSENHLIGNGLTDINPDLSGWYLNSNPNYLDNDINSNMLVILYTTLSNSINNSQNNILFRLPIDPNTNTCVESNLLAVTQISDESANDITEKLILNNINYPNVLYKYYPLRKDSPNKENPTSILYNSFKYPERLDFKIENFTYNAITIKNYLLNKITSDELKHRVLLGGDFTGNGEITISDFLNFKGMIEDPSRSLFGYMTNQLIVSNDSFNISSYSSNIVNNSILKSTQNIITMSNNNYSISNNRITINFNGLNLNVKMITAISIITDFNIVDNLDSINSNIYSIAVNQSNPSLKTVIYRDDVNIIDLSINIDLIISNSEN